MFGMLAVLVRDTAFGSVALAPMVTLTSTARMSGRSTAATGAVDEPSGVSAASENAKRDVLVTDVARVRVELGAADSSDPVASGNE
jgi:hypothetical protein